jgi:hypothetical protein
LDVEEAVRISRTQIVKYFPEPREWLLLGVDLNSFYPGPKWYYKVSWRPRGDTGDALEIPVLMSGQTVALAFED